MAPVASDADGSLAAIGVPPEQALEDLKHLGELILSRQPEEGEELEKMHQRYLDATPPARGQKATLAYRLRLMYLDRWNLWRPLTRYRTWHGPQGQRVDGTNNGCERAIGWWIKERYRLAPTGSDHAGLQTPQVGCACQPPAGLVWQSSGAWRGGPRPPYGLGANPQATIQPQSAYSYQLPNSERSHQSDLDKLDSASWA